MSYKPRFKNYSNESKRLAHHQLRTTEKPTKEEQLQAVSLNGNAIKHLIVDGKDPDLDVQLAAVRQNGNSIAYLHDPPLYVQLEAVKQHGLAYRYLEPFPKSFSDADIEYIQAAAVRQNGEAIRYMEHSNPTQYVRDLAHQQTTRADKYIKHLPLPPQPGNYKPPSIYNAAPKYRDSLPRYKLFEYGDDDIDTNILKVTYNLFDYVLQDE